MHHFAVLLSLGWATLWAQLSGVYTVGTGGNYATLTAAFNALTSQGVNGPVEFRLTSNYMGEPGSTTSLRVTPYSGMGTHPVTLTVDPAVTSPITVATAPTTGVLSRFVLRLEGVDNFIIDGGPQRLLRFQNNNPNSGTGVIALLSDNNFAPTPCRNISLRNIEVDGQDKSQTRVGIYLGSSGSSLIEPANLSGSNNILIEKCWVYGVQEGIILYGNSTTRDQNNVVRGCKIGHPTPILSWGGSNYSAGIVAAYQSNLRIERDTVFNASSSTNYGYTGIVVGRAPQSTTAAVCDNVHLAGNWIYDIQYTGSSGWQAYGVVVNVGGLSPANIYVYNNFIAGISADGWQSPGSSDNAYGIYCQGTSNSNAGIYIYHNSVHLYGTPPSNSYTNSNPSCLGIASSITGGVYVRNNIFQNTQSPPNPTSTRTTIAIAYGGSSPSVFAELDNNAYYVSNSGGSQYAFIGALGSSRYATLSAWQTAVGGGREQNSLSLSAPGAPFSSQTDLHIPHGTTTPIEGGGVLLTSPIVIAEDIDGDLRPDGSAAPDIGADEFVAVVPPCPSAINADQLTISPSTVTVGSSGGSFTVSVQTPSNVTSPARWYVRYNSGPWQLVGGYNPSSPTLVYTPTAVGSYDFVLIAYVAPYHSGCSGLQNDTSNVVTGTAVCPTALNADQISVSPTSVPVGQSVTVTVTNPSAVTLPAQWQVSTDGGATWTGVGSYTGSPYLYTPTQIVTYQIRLAALPPTGCGGSLSPAYSNVETFTVTPPPGDSITNPINITPTTPTRTDTIVNGNNSLPGYRNNYTGPGNQSSPDVYYLYVLRECLDSIRVSTCSSTGFGSSNDLYLHVIHLQTNRILYTDGGRCGGTNTILQAALDITHDPAATGSSQVTSPYRSTMRLQQGDSLIIVVQGWSSNTGPFVLDVTEYRYNPSNQPTLPQPPFFSFDTSRVCFRGGIARDTLNTGITTPGLTHVWYLNGLQVAGVSGNEYLPQFTAPGTATVVVEIRSASLSYCAPAQNIPRDTVYILVDSLPKEQFLVNGASLYNHADYASLSGTDPLCVTYEPSIVNPAFTFTWTINGNTYTGPGPHQECYTAAQAADTVVLIATNGACVEYDTLYVILDITTGLRGREQGLVVYPNPAKDQVYLRAQQSGLAQVRLFDPRGGLVWEHTTTLQAQQPYTIPVRELPAGIYLLEVRQGERLLQTRLAIQP